MCRWLATLAVVFLSAAPLFAQQPPAIGRPPGVGSPGYHPPVSPYLNLGRGGLPAINYYGLVRPQIDGAHAIGQIEQQLNAPQGVLGLPGLGGTLDPLTGQPAAFNPYGGVGGAGQVTTTPLPAGFFTHNRYYMTVRPGPSTGSGGGGGGGNQGGGNRQPNFGMGNNR
jgi:hypothetical protein